ncbi:sterol homeostasis protein [Coemansia sp. RSA 2610]|nr:sterol homeostasis protein [Coemansia sp. RSA 2610]
MAAALLPLKYYVHTLICTLSATSFKSVRDAVSCNRIGCECHVLDDPQQRVALSLLTILLIAGAALSFGPKTPDSPLMADQQQHGTKQVCVECGHPVAHLFTVYGAGHIRLTQCAHCKCFADKYVEHDVVIMFIDMLLHKPQVYRHLLVNRLEFRQASIERNVGKLGVLLVLFNVYIDWFRLEEGGRLRGQRELLFGRQHSFAVQYVFILLCSAVDALALLAGVLAAAAWLQRAPQLRRWPTVATALVVSSFGKVLMILLVIWEYNESYFPWLLDALQFTSQATAVGVLFAVSSAWAAVAVVFAMAAKQLAHYVVLCLAAWVV